MIIGVTGHRGVGKSELMKIFQSHGFFVVDADEVVNDLYCSEAAKVIGDKFGSEFVKDGVVDKLALKKLLVSDPYKLPILNKLMHGFVKDKIEVLIRNKRNVIIEAVYFESGLLLDFINKLIFVQSDRVKKEEPFYSYLENFYSENRAVVDFNIANNGTLNDLEAQVVEILGDLPYKG